MSDSNEVWFEVPFVAFQARPRMVVRFGRPAMYVTEEQRREREAVAAAYREAGGGIIDGPVEVDVVVTSPLPTRRPKRVASEAFTVKPDVDNVLKGVLDALNGVAWTDDAHVTQVIGIKAPRGRGGRKGTFVCVRPAREGARRDG